MNINVKWIKMPIDDGIGRKDRRFDLQKSPLEKKLPQPVQQIGAELEIFQGSGGKIIGPLHTVIAWKF